MALKTLGNIQIDSKRMFVGFNYHICETINGDFVLMNGQPVADRALLELLPEQHRQKALDWWERTFGKKEEVKVVPIVEETLQETMPIEKQKEDTNDTVSKIKDRADKVLEKMGLGKKK